MLLLLGVTITPVETIGLNYLLTIHLVQNVVLAEWAPALAVLGIPPALAASLPRVPPIPALLLWLVNYGVWHLPWVYDAALRNPHTLLHLEHALYFADRRPPLVAGRARGAFARLQGRLSLRRLRAREPDRLAAGADSGGDLRLLRRGAETAVGTVAARRPADRGRNDGARAGGRLLRRRSRSTSPASSASRTRSTSPPRARRSYQS